MSSFKKWVCPVCNREFRSAGIYNLNSVKTCIKCYNDANPDSQFKPKRKKLSGY